MSGVFARLVGQDAVESELTAAARAARGDSDHVGSMTHAWLITGPPGSGRSVAALCFAAALVGCCACLLRVLLRLLVLAVLLRLAALAAALVCWLEALVGGLATAAGWRTPCSDGGHTLPLRRESEGCRDHSRTSLAWSVGHCLVACCWLGLGACGHPSAGTIRPRRRSSATLCRGLALVVRHSSAPSAVARVPRSLRASWPSLTSSGTALALLRPWGCALTCGRVLT